MANYTVSYKPKSVVEVEFEVNPETIQAGYKRALERASHKVQLKGFRKGKAPLAMVEQAVSVEGIYQDALNEVIPAQFENILKQESEKNNNKKFIILDAPKYEIKGEWKQGESLNMFASCTIYPEIDIKNIAEKIKIQRKDAKSISEDEVNESLNKLFAQYKKIKEADSKNKNVVIEASSEQAKEVELAIDDEFAKAAGASDLLNLKSLLKNELEFEEKSQAEKEFEDQVVKEIIENTKVEIPDILVEEEINRIQSRFTEQLTRIGTTIDKYLETEQKTLEDLRKDWVERAIENTTLSLALNQWRLEHNIEVTENEIEMFALQNKISGKRTQYQNDTLKYVLLQSKALGDVKEKVQSK